MSVLVLPVQAPAYATPCPACGGSGVTGDRYQVEAGEHTLLADVICPACGGCGNGDPAHAGCPPLLHAGTGDDEEPWGDEDDQEYDDAGCPSCGSGRGWYPVQGFTGDGDDAEMCTLRMPCGCSEPRLVPA